MAARAETAAGPAGPLQDRRYGPVVLATWIILAILLTNVDRAFQTRSAIEALAQTGEGSRLRQSVYLLALLGAAGLVVRQHALGGLARLFPLPLMALFLWAAVTLFWSPVPGIGGRRLVLTFIVAATVLCLAAVQPPEDLLRRFRQVVVALALASLVLAILAPGLAIHQPDDPEPLIIGDWRGVFYHKNIFGSVLAAAVLVALYEALTRPRGKRQGTGLTVLFLSAMLVLSGSKTSLGLAGLLAGLLWLMLALGRRRGGLLLLSFGVYVLALAVLTGVVLWMNHSGAGRLIEEDSFTGRGIIWTSLLRMAEGRMAFGLGYQSIFLAGAQSPLVAAFQDDYLLTLAHAHSAYVEALISTGWVGVVLFGVALILAPAAGLARLPAKAPQTRFILLALLLLTWMHGLLESGLFDRDRVMWIVFLVALGALRRMSARQDGTDAT
ncbi:MAG: hypothetical protein RIR62_3357 [Pseudomonadota bacterium]|jgi:O-antigen ligase